jgi:16S rRNA (guanine(966)-N(2))-methyltransferase RsmD
LDLYAGTGAVGIEALSRGAAHVTAVESNRTARALLRRNLLDCGMADRMTVRAQTVQQFLRRSDQWEGPYDLVFADPPYAVAHELASLLADVAEAALLAPDSWLVVEHAAKTALPDKLGAHAHRKSYHYGDTILSVYAAPETAQP